MPLENWQALSGCYLVMSNWKFSQAPLVISSFVILLSTILQHYLCSSKQGSYTVLF